MNKLKKIFTKNDIWRYIGLALIILGAYQEKEVFVLLGMSLPTNMTQATGFILLFLPHILRYLDLKKESKSNTDLPQV